MVIPRICPACVESLRHALDTMGPATVCFSCLCIMMGVGKVLTEKVDLELAQPTKPSLHVVPPEDP